MISANKLKVYGSWLHLLLRSELRKPKVEMHLDDNFCGGLHIPRVRLEVALEGKVYGSALSIIVHLA